MSNQASGEKEPSVVHRLGSGVLWLQEQLERGMYYATAILLSLLALAIVYDVTLRKLFNAPTSWATAGASYALFFVALMPAAYILRRGGHIRMSIVLDYLPAGVVRWINILEAFVAAATCGVLAWYTGAGTWSAYSYGYTYHSGFDVSQALIWFIMPVGFGLLGMGFIRIFVITLNERTGTGAGEEEGPF